MAAVLIRKNQNEGKSPRIHHRCPGGMRELFVQRFIANGDAVVPRMRSRLISWSSPQGSELVKLLVATAQ
jgi:hypothetical protein